MKRIDNKEDLEMLANHYHKEALEEIADKLNQHIEDGDYTKEELAEIFDIDEEDLQDLLEYDPEIVEEADIDFSFIEKYLIFENLAAKIMDVASSPIDSYEKVLEEIKDKEKEESEEEEEEKPDLEEKLKELGYSKEDVLKHFNAVEKAEEKPEKKEEAVVKTYEAPGVTIKKYDLTKKEDRKNFTEELAKFDNLFNRLFNPFRDTIWPW